VDIDGGNLTEIYSDTEFAAINPDWSPDGKLIAFATVHKSPAAVLQRRVVSGDDIWLIGADGNGLLCLTREEVPEWSPTWGADGRVYFVSRRNTHQNIWSVKPLQLGATTSAGSPPGQ
jgi:Tol biopolymer transport system component